MISSKEIVPRAPFVSGLQGDGEDCEYSHHQSPRARKRALYPPVWLSRMAEHIRSPHILCLINRGGAVRVLAFGIVGAFDMVFHCRAIHMAESYGIIWPLLRWLANYLLDRKLQVGVWGGSYQLFPINADVPQGSILSPKLVLIYVNDPCNVLLAVITPAT